MARKTMKDRPIKEGNTWYAPTSKGSFKRIRTGTGKEATCGLIGISKTVIKNQKGSE